MKVFLSYRREDSGGYSGRLADDLVNHFGESRVFRDVDSIRPGVDFVQAIEEAVASCAVLVAVIGREWLDVRNESGARRLDSPEDFVRLEIAAALRRNIPIVPVLVERAQMPTAAHLPQDLSRLLRYNAIELHEPGWAYGVGELIEVLEDRIQPSRTTVNAVRYALPLAVVVIGLASAVALFRADRAGPTSRSADPSTPIGTAAPSEPPRPTAVSVDTRNLIASYDRPSGVYFGPITTSVKQVFVAASSRITYVAVYMGIGGSQNLPVSGSVRVELCADKDCRHVLDLKTPRVVNYDFTVAAFNVRVVPGRTYAVRWYRPDYVNAENPGDAWDVFWTAGSAGEPERKPIEEAKDFVLRVMGDND